ncbi:hypothetical protein [Kurthia sibirica]|uniref:Aminodeoxychorismate lyase n=1 Tax=Kurthia sibirica TaxID=202750 RepID=A0A2U3AM10_9BACL|nr:hypothetical protein [Kurthia sibirica]PWI25550.1 hypothetical protein DEX24_08050 [Kurthia sibirica]GEK33927.1 hypothetical protein KSI01_14600 [Kurthia sibirica]
MKAIMRSFGIALFIAGAAMSVIQMNEVEPKEPIKEAFVTADELAKVQQQLQVQQQVNDKLTAQLKKQSQKKANQPKIVQYTLNVKSGMGTSEVSTALQQAKMIEDANDFEELLINEGLSSKIQLGKSKLDSTMSQKEIVAVITARK